MVKACISCEIALRWISLDSTDDNMSTLIQAMAWCCQATCYFLSQCWPRSMLTCGITRPQWVNIKSFLNTIFWILWEFALNGIVLSCIHISISLDDSLKCEIDYRLSVLLTILAKSTSNVFLPCLSASLLCIFHSTFHMHFIFAHLVN